MVAHMLKRAGKWMWGPEHVVLAAGSGDLAGGAKAEFASTEGLNLVFPRSVPFSM
jgi:hypothetical protein